MPLTEPISKSLEKCWVCGEETFFRIEAGTCLRREAHCDHCQANRRTSDAARGVLRACLGSDDGCLQKDAPKLAPLAIYNTQAWGALHEILRALPRYVCSEFLDGVELGKTKDGVRCEDLTRLRLPSDAFDLVLSEEVLEHVQDYEAALLEVRRVLKPGGHFVFTVPVNEAHATQRRAAIDDTGALVELLPPVHHGDPARPQGSLVYTDFGGDLADILASFGLPAEDLVCGQWHANDEVTWIGDDAAHADYLKHYRDGTLFSAFRYNSHVFIARNLKLAFTGERFVPESTAPVLSEYEHVHRYALAAGRVEGKTVLDIACGEGFGSALLAARATRVVGVDVSAETVGYAKERYAKVANLEFREGSCERIPCEDRSVDVVVSMETIEHIPDAKKFLAEVKRVLRPGGVLFVSTPNIAGRRPVEDEKNPFHVHEMPIDEFHATLGGFFAHVAILAQRTIPASFIHPSNDSAPMATTTWSGDAHRITEATGVRFVPKFHVAACSDAAEAVNVPPSVFFSPRHEDWLDVCVSPQEKEALVKQFVEAGEWAKGLQGYAKALEEERNSLKEHLEKKRLLPAESPAAKPAPPAPAAPRALRRRAVCTICSNNYLHFARTLMKSVREVHPDWDPYVLLVDENRGVFDPAKEAFTVVPFSELPIPNPRQFCFRYTILELNTAVKPWILEYLFDKKGYDQVIYLDPDIYLYEPMTEVENLLWDDAGGAFMVLTPHLTGQLDDDLKPSELEILRAGAWNLGFIALRKHANTLPFLRWWQKKVEYDCVVDFENGLFVDQKWMELVPGMFADVAILRHEGYNVAYWNLKHRKMTRHSGRLFANADPVVFFHFSGLNPLVPGPVSKHQDRFSMDNLGSVARAVVRDYCDAVIANGLETCRKWPYAFGFFTDGLPVLDCMRVYYRKHLEPEGAVKGDPFDLGHDYFHQPWGTTDPDAPLVTYLMRGYWEYRKDVRDHFRDIEGPGRYGYAYWFVEEIKHDLDLPPCCIEPVRKSLQSGADAAQATPRKSWWNVFRLRRMARKVLPRRMQRRLQEIAQPPPGHMQQRPGLMRRVARMLPGPLKRRIKGMMTPAPMVPDRARRHPVSPLQSGSGIYYTGFYDNDLAAEEVWMGTDASVRILKPAAGRLVVSGIYQPHYFRAAKRPAQTTLECILDGRSLGEITLEKDGPFEASFDVDAPSESKSALLTLRAGQTFVPAEVGMGEDRRRLSLRIGRIALGGEVLLDFSRRPRPFMPDVDVVHEAVGLNIVGYLQSELGVGESARLCVASARAANIPYSLVDFTLGCYSRSSDDRLSRQITNENPHRVNLFHINADQMLLASSSLGQEFFRDRYNVGFWHWELPEFPDEWIPSFAFLQEIWVPSLFVMGAVSEKSPVPVVRIPHALGFSVTPGVARAAFGLPEGKFLFLMMYDMHSFQARKNPEAAVDAFRRAFPASGDVALVIKTMNTATYPDEWAALQKRLASAPNIVTIDKTLSRQEVYDLESLCDCFVSLHRSEGFGLGLAESMYLGKPVIGTNWSGNVDFMNEGNSCPVRYSIIELDRDYGPYRKGSHWADADAEHAAWFMKKIVEDASFRRSIAEAGRETIHEHYSPRVVGEMYRKRLEIIAKML